MVPTIIGGVGLFLLGMLLLTDGLQTVAGEALRSILARFTSTPLRAVISGTVVTSLIQSSSITTLVTIGFVSAELLTLSRAIGVIYGANIGTTTTSWLVSLIGLKVKLEVFALPMVGVGALLRLFSRGRLAAAGMALAGFGLIFVGIEVLQTGLSGVADTIDLAQFAGSGITARLALVFVGVVMTVLLQSSSAAMATTLTALFAGAISLEQGAALCIGQAVGTTVTAALGSLSGSIEAKRAAMAHVLFNVVTALIAFALLPLFLYIVSGARQALSPADQAVSLAAFLTTFKLTGVLVFYPFTELFARLIERLIPDKRSLLTRRLSSASLSVPAIALEAAHRTIFDLFVRLNAHLRHLLTSTAHHATHPGDGSELRRALASTRAFLGMVHSHPSDAIQYTHHISLLHALDHLDRLVDASIETPNWHTYRRQRVLQREAHGLALALGQVDQAASAESLPVDVLQSVSFQLAEQRRQRRLTYLEQAASGELHPDDAVSLLEALRWLDRLAYHTWRGALHLTAPSAEFDPRCSPENDLPALPVSPPAANPPEAEGTASADAPSVSK